jgi:hypothetical protein
MLKRNATFVLLFIFFVSPSASFAQQPAPAASPANTQGSQAPPRDPK